ncbi:hypothetical protein [Salinispora arenicola]|uniref:hypothetical protein n=1 Tax=Salinispora arenicola TaxID=168697 RepID=UPI0004B31A2C|nr:hypothetical protein [Salinispora arenicola]
MSNEIRARCPAGMQVPDCLGMYRGTHREQAWAGAETEAIHHERYLVAKRLYLTEVNPCDSLDRDEPGQPLSGRPGSS